MSSELPISSKYRSTPGAPVDEGERERLTRQLNDAYTRGQLDSDDYHQRLDRLYQAQSLGELVPVVEGLGPVPTHSQPAIVQQGDRAPGEVGAAPSGQRFSRLMLAMIAGAGILLILLILLLVIF